MENLPLIKKGEMLYPVGTNILDNLPTINEMGVVSIDFLKINYSRQNQVNLFCKGSSGAIISSLVGKALIDAGYVVQIHHIKKEGEHAHTNHTINDDTFYNSVSVIVDDFVATGRTIRSIIDTMRNAMSFPEKHPEFDILLVSGIVTEDIAVHLPIKFGIMSQTRR